MRRGLYAYQLAWWLRHFPAKHLLVINHEEVWEYVCADAEGSPLFYCLAAASGHLLCVGVI